MQRKKWKKNQANKSCYTYGLKNTAIMELKPVFSKKTSIIFIRKESYNVTDDPS